MTTSDACALSCYLPVAELNASHQVTLVQHRETRRIYVRKELEIYNIDV